jgi:UDP-glucose 4-epimerase
VNILGSLNLLHCCATYGVRRFVYAASGGTIAGDPQYFPIDEEHPKSPRSPYGVSKLTVEYYMNAFASIQGLSSITLRYGNVYGPRQDPYGEAGVIAIFTGQMLRGEPVTIHHTGEQQKDYVYVIDVAAANVLALNSSVTGAYNIASGQPTSVNTLFQNLSELTGYAQQPLHGARREGDVEFYLDIGKAERELGWRPTTTLEEGLRQTVEFYRKELSRAATGD